MSDSEDNNEISLPDDADSKIDELLAALRESEAEMTGKSQSASEDAVESAEEVASEEQDEDFLTEEEGDFVDLDAEQLDNSADKLLLDEGQFVEEEGISGLEAEEEFDSGPDFADELNTNAAEQDAMEATELARARLDELEQKLAAVESTPLHVPAPAVSSKKGVSGGFSALLALLALVLSGAALWYTYTSTPAEQAMPVAANSADAELQSLKRDLAAMRERLSVVEKQAEQGGEEAVVMLDRMQTVLTRLERKIIASAAATSSGTATAMPGTVAPGEGVKQSMPEPEAGDAHTQKDVETDAEVVNPDSSVAALANQRQTSGESAADSQSSDKVFVKGWAVNLRSYYHRADADRLMQRYQQAGIDAQVREIPKGDATWHRVRVMGFKSKQEANAFIEGLTIEQGRDIAWPSYYQGYIDG